MRNTVVPTTVVTLLAAASVGCSGDVTGEPDVATTQAAIPNEHAGCPHDTCFEISSPSFDDGDALPDANTCQDKAFGRGTSPELNWTGAPHGTHSYAIVLRDTSLEDPNFAFHWAIWNIPVDLSTLPAGLTGTEAPDDPFPAGLQGAQQVQARGAGRYFAPCPDWVVGKAILCDWNEPLPVAVPDSYTFTIYALGQKNVKVPDHDPNVNPNYVDRLNTIFAHKAVGQASIAFTSDAVPTALPPVGPFLCENPPLDPNAD